MLTRLITLAASTYLHHLDSVLSDSLWPRRKKPSLINNLQYPVQILEGKEERTDEEEGKYDERRGSGENSGLLGFIESVPTPNGRKKARKGRRGGILKIRCREPKVALLNIMIKRRRATWLTGPVVRP